MKIAACIEYDGSKFRGWQTQRGEPTVQSAVEQALSSIADEEITVHCAGRTDTGVHACGQVVHFETGAERSARSWVQGANTMLPSGVSLLWTRPVADDFHARFSALSRAYRYVILNRPVRPTYLAGKVAWIHEELDVKRMRSGARCLLGKHDFSAFRSSRCANKVPVKNMQALEVGSQGEWVWMDVEADGFLHHMVRNIAGSLLAVGCGDHEPRWVEEVLQSKDRTRGGVTAAPDGLYFVKAAYPERFALPSPPPACRYW